MLTVREPEKSGLWATAVGRFFFYVLKVMELVRTGVDEPVLPLLEAPVRVAWRARPSYSVLLLVVTTLRA